MTIFDKPAWTLKLPPEGADLSEPHIITVTVDSPSGIRDVSVAAPPQLYTFAESVLGIASLKDASYVIYHSDIVTKRWYFIIDVGDKEFYLWYYTRSTLPGWAK